MAIVDTDYIKVVQAFNMPDAVEALCVFYYKADFQEEQTEEIVVDTAKGRMDTIFTTLDDEISDLVTMGPMTVYVFDAFLAQWDNIGSDVPLVDFVNVNEMLPHGVAAMVRAYTVRGRTVGRKYVPGFTEGANEDGAWSAAAITALGLFGEAWGSQGPIDGNNRLNPGVWSTVGGAVFELIDEFVVLTNPTYQRRRRPGVGS